MMMHRWVSILGSRRAVLATALTVSFGACGDDDPSGDTIDDTTADVDTDSSPPDTSDTNDTADADPDTTPTATVVINEVAPAGDPADWVELHNPSGVGADISGWVFRDDDDAHAYQFPAGTVIPAGGYKVVERIDPGLGEGFDFGLGGADSARLYDAGGVLVDETSWLDGAAPAERSWGRIPNASGAFATLITPTPGAANEPNPSQTCDNGTREGLEVCDGTDFAGLSCEGLGWGGGQLSCLESCTRIGTSGCTARAAGLVINEVESDDTDRIELFNGTGAPIDLGGYTYTDEGDNTFTIASGTTIAAGAHLVFERDVHHVFGLGDADGLTLEDDGGVEIDRVSWGLGQAIPAWCRMPNGTGGFSTCDNESFGAANF
ncbi:MAG TPA: lamin tail domain-containing protein [Myxococcota bacterium]|nr:lamin tail domain-containing protein [Myxococcota bacterium]